MSIIGNSLFIGSSGGGGSGPILLVTVTGVTATSVTAVNGGQSVSLAYDSDIGKWWAVLPSTGTWTVTASGSIGNTKSTTVSASSVTVYEVSLQLGILPDGYTQLSYIQSSGTQYVLTMLKAQSYLRVKGKINFVSLATSLPTTIFGAQRAVGSSYKRCFIDTTTNDDKRWRVCASKVYGSAPNAILASTDYSFDAIMDESACSLLINGNNVSLTDLGYTGAGIPTDDYLAIFSCNVNGTPNATIGNWKLIDNMEFLDSNGNALSTVYPAKRNSDNHVALYDITLNEFYPNSGSGSFIAGPEV